MPGLPPVAGGRFDSVPTPPQPEGTSPDFCLFEATGGAETGSRTTSVPGVALVELSPCRLRGDLDSIARAPPGETPFSCKVEPRLVSGIAEAVSTLSRVFFARPCAGAAP